MKQNNLDILYEDNHIIVVVKPNNIPVQEDSSKDMDMLTLIKQYLKVKYKKPGNVYLGLVHRLDRPVNGVMVFAKTSKAASRLGEDMKNNYFKKKYLAVVHGYFANKQDVLINYINKDSNNNSVITTKDKGKYAELSYRVLQEKNNLSLIDIDLKTGRHHQIRVQFANVKHPLYGDQRYGEQDKKQIALQAYYLEFRHPITKEIMNFEIEMNRSGVWSIFEKK